MKLSILAAFAVLLVVVVFVDSASVASVNCREGGSESKCEDKVKSEVDKPGSDESIEDPISPPVSSSSANPPRVRRNPMFGFPAIF